MKQWANDTDRITYWRKAIGADMFEFVETVFSSSAWLFMMQWIHLGVYLDIDSLVQDCSISSALTIDPLQSCTKPSICFSPE